MWSPDPTIGGAQWRGNATLATTRQLNNISTTLTNQLLSTSIGLQSTITGTSNYLQTEINAIVSGGGAALWSQYGAIHNVDISGYKITNAKTVSTQELFTSSINGNDVNFFGSTVTVGGVTFVGGAITTSNITVQPAKGGGGGGGNNPTTGGSGNNTFTMVNNAVGAVMDTVSKTQQAIGGILNNTGAVLFQTYYAVETAGAIIDLANGAVQLATNAQAMYDTREQNLIAGPGGPPGQTSYVYETISGTTQLQFSTIGAPVYSVFRTTDQVNPNQTFGREIFTSTIIPAGSKVVRSVSDPYQFPIMSTQAISTTNYLQSFGQWHALLEPDYNLKTSTLTASSVQSYFGNISTLTVSSINGFIPINSQNINASSISTNYIYATNSYIKNLTVSTLTASTIVVENVIDNYVSTTTGFFDAIYTSSIQGVLTPYLNSTTTQTFDSISSIYQPIINAVITGSDSGPQQFGLQDFQIFDAANIVFWNGKSFKKFYAGTCVISFNAGGIQNGAYIDISVVSGATINVIDRGGLVISLTTPGTTNRLTWSASSVVFVVTTAPAPTITTLGNSFQLGQSFDAVLISTPYQLVVNAGETIFNQQLTANDSLIGNSFSYLSTLQTNGITFSSAPNQPYDLTNTFTSTVAGGYDNVSSLKQNILDYNLSANLTGEGVIYLGASFTCQNNDGSWAGQFMIARGFSEVFLYTANATNYFDIQNQGPTQIVTVYLSINGNVTTFLRLTPGTPIYRVTATVTAGVTVWTYALSPGVITPSFVQNNLTISQDLQRVYISSMNTIQFNAGDIYMNGALEATTAIFNNTTIQQAFISSISTGSISLGNLSLASLTTGTLTATNNISSYNQVAIIQTDGNAQKVDPLKIYTNYTTVGEPSYGYYSPFRTYDNLSTINMLTSQMKYNVYDGYVNVGLGSVSNITFDSNYDLYINNVYLGRPGNKASLGFISIPYNGGFGSFSGAMIRVMNTLPNPPGTALNAFSVTLSNRSGAGGSDYVHLYGAGWNSGQVNTDIYMPTYSTGNPAVMYNQAGSNTISILDASPGTPFPNTTQTTIPNDTVSITHVPGGALSSIIQIASPILNLNSQLYWGSNTKRIAMFSMRMVAFLISKTAPGGQAYGFADVGGFVTDVNGNLFKTSEYTVNCTFGQVNCESQRTLALNSCSLTTEDNGGYWFVHCYATTPTIPAVSTGGNDVVWAVNVLAMPTELASFQNYQPSRNVGDVIPSSIGAFELQAQLIAPDSHLSSITASTITLQATENASFLAGGFTVPTYLSTGSITVAGTNQASVLGDYAVIGGQKDVDIQANTNNVNIVAGSNINLTGSNSIQLNSSNVNINTVTTIQVSGTGSIPSVSPLALTNGNQYDGAQNKSQIEFQFYGGGFNHYISSRHDANVVYGTGNAIDFWLYSVYTGGDAQTASSAPGTGNVNSMTIAAANVIIYRPLYSISDFNRRLSGTDIVQPIIQYGTETGGGTSGSVTISLPVAYTSATSYVAMVAMEDSTPAKMSVTRDSDSQITIYWAQAGSGAQTLCWTTSGT